MNCEVKMNRTKAAVGGCSEKSRKIHSKTPPLESLFDYVAGLKACNFIKNRLHYRYFPVNMAKFLITVFLKKHLRWLLRQNVISYSQLRKSKISLVKKFQTIVIDLFPTIYLRCLAWLI